MNAVVMFRLAALIFSLLLTDIALLVVTGAGHTTAAGDEFGEADGFMQFGFQSHSLDELDVRPVIQSLLQLFFLC